MEIMLQSRITADHRSVGLPMGLGGVDHGNNAKVMKRITGNTPVGYDPHVIHSTFDFSGAKIHFLTGTAFQRIVIHRLCSCLGLEYTAGRHSRMGYRKTKEGREPGCSDPYCILRPLPDGHEFYDWSQGGASHGMVLWATPVSQNGGVAFERRLATLFPEVDPLMFALMGPSLADNFNRLLQGLFLRKSDRDAWERTLDDSSRTLSW